MLKFANRDDARANWRAHFENRSVKDAAPKKLQIRASAQPDTTDIMLYDEIGYWGVTAKEFVGQLASITTPKVNLRINSPGGDVFDGIAIYSALKAYNGEVTATVEGLAASAASFIALASKNVIMAENAFLMIHNAWGFAIGNKADMRDMAGTLEKLDTQLASIYAGKCGKPVAEMSELMDGDVDGTWFTAQEAKDLGLIDAINKDDPDQDGVESGDDDNDGDGKKARAISRMRMRLRLAETV